jgi:hypothetical protein
MAANGISTHLPKEERRDLKMDLAETKRKADGDTSAPYYRPLNEYVSPGQVSPSPGHPWEPVV